MSFPNAKRQMSSQIARAERNQMKLNKLRDRVRQSTSSFIARQQARMSWWQTAFRAPVLISRIASGFSSLWMMFLGLLGITLTGKASARVVRDMFSGRAKMRNLLCEGLESRELMAYAINTPIAVDGIVNFQERLAVVVSGTATTETQATVAVQDGVNTVVQTVPVVSGNWTATLNVSGLLDTTEGQPANLSVLVFQPGNVVNQANTTIEKDTVAPSVSLPFDIATDDTINIAESSSLTITGATAAASIGQTVTLQFSSGAFSETRTATVYAGGAGGIFSNSTPVNVSAWGHNAVVTVTASISDSAANVGTASRSATTDFVGPSAPTITAPTNGQAFNAASGAALVVTGVGIPGGAITITTQPAGATFNGVAGATGSFSIPVPINSLPTGPVQINVSNVDDAGNPGTSFVTVDLDATAPTLTIDGLALVLANNVAAFPFSGSSNASLSRPSPTPLFTPFE